ncbi:MAG: stage II sporulation protein P [Acutalibacter sp.]|nr:stage II sporulation protein P [Acutalibacter sp.]
MRKKHFRSHRVKNIAAFLCLAVCLWCAGTSLQGWAAEEGPGGGQSAEKIGTNTRGSSEWGVSALPGRLSMLEDSTRVSESLLLSNGGVVPFLEDILPGAVATPDPERNSAPVEEIVLSGGTQVDNFFVRDTTESGTDLLAELLENPSVQLKGDGSVEILLYHTHTSEAYSRQYTGFYYTDMDTRTQNQDMSVVAVGEAVKRELEARGYGVVHDTTVNDTLFNGSYSRSWEVIQKNLAEYPGIQVTIDLHRDSMTTQEGLKYKPTAVINGRKAAQIMLLAGCNAHDDWEDFPNWEQNLRLMLRVQQKAAELYPEFVRPLNFSNSKYNMNATPGSMLIEVGTEVNTVSEATYSGRLLGEILAETFDSLK